jgi:leucyl aminopeptidase
MKDIISVSVRAKKTEPQLAKADVLSLGIFEEETKKLCTICSRLDNKVGGAIKDMIGLGDFKGKAKSTALIYTQGKIPAKRIMLVGMGKRDDFDTDVLRKAAAAAAHKAIDLKAKSLALCLHCCIGKKIDDQMLGQVIAEGVYLGGYRYDEYITQNKKRVKKLTVDIIEPKTDTLRGIKAGLSTGAILGQSQRYARTIANRPGNVINPPVLADIARNLAKETPGLTCKIFNESQLKQMGMGGILAVGSGSKSQPRLIVLKYSGQSAAKTKTVGLVGKAITFDSGGISIKPASGMQDMKLDKSGGIAVLGAMKAIAELKPNITVYGLIPSAENMPGGSSYRPGDIITTYSKKTVEVQNTDAEGRMILCDALKYAAEQKCEVIVDIATLTGACMVALGKYKAGLMGNDDEIIERLKKASEQSGEQLWHLPSGDEYLEEMKSKIADLKNIGSRWGGACTAASFLSQFVDDAKWAHIDMAGVDMFEGNTQQTAGSTGFGVRLLTTFVMNMQEDK